MPKKSIKGMTDIKKFETAREEIKQAIKDGKLLIGWTKSSVPGVLIVEAKLADSEAPVGTVWIRHEMGNSIAVWNSYVDAVYRRCGIRTAIHKQILEWFPNTRTVVTGSANELSYPWLTKMGFVFNEDMNRWELIIPKAKETKKKK